MPHLGYMYDRKAISEIIFITLWEDSLDMTQQNRVIISNIFKGEVYYRNDIALRYIVPAPVDI